jgi:tellurite resistance protein
VDNKTKTIYHRPPSKDALIALAALQSAATKALDKKQKLGHYAVFWKNGEVTLKHFDKQSDETQV